MGAFAPIASTVKRDSYRDGARDVAAAHLAGYGPGLIEVFLRLPQ
jgi:hypothetical protein